MNGYITKPKINSVGPKCFCLVACLKTDEIKTFGFASKPQTFYCTLGGKTDKLDEAVNRELNVTRS